MGRYLKTLHMPVVRIMLGALMLLAGGTSRAQEVPGSVNGLATTMPRDAVAAAGSPAGGGAGSPVASEPPLVPASPESTVVVPGAGYAKSGFVKFFAGKGYRDLWTVPIKVEVADLSSIGGGLSVIRLGGGMTTRTLHMMGRDGKRYVGRSVNKYPGQGLDEELQGTVYESVLQDQISSFHPSAALVLPTLLDAVGVLHLTPRLYVLPDTEELGEYRNLMGGELVIIEELPNEGPDGTPGFAGSRRIVDTPALFEDLEKDNRNQLDAPNFLAARLVDLIVGDRDRSVNNWRWARFEDEDAYVWKPIPRDRDQAFIELDGFATSIVRMYEPRMVRFSRAVPNVVSLTRSAWAMDRPFLSSIDKPTWDSVVTAVQTSLSDSVIAEAIRRMPAEHQQANGAALAEQLRRRRDSLPTAADRFYRIVARYADVHTSDRPEVARVDVLDDGSTAVTVYAYSGSPASVAATPFFSRTFDPRETREIRLYLHGGADKVTVSGRSRDAIPLRIIGGGDADTLVNSSSSVVKFYDAGNKTHVVGQDNVRQVDRNVPRPNPWGDNGPRSPDWGSVWLPRFSAPYTTDMGLLVYAGAFRTGYGFLRDPSNEIKFGAGFAPMENKFVADFSYEAHDIVSGVDGTFDLDYSGIEILNYYGLGNDTREIESRDYYEAHRGGLRARTVATASIARHVDLDLDLRLEWSDTDVDTDEPTLVSDQRPYGSGSMVQGGSAATIRIDSRDRMVAPTSGLLATGSVAVYPKVLDLDRGAFTNVSGEIATYLSLTASGNQVVALCVGGEKVFGDFPYYESAFLGGPYRLRGFREERFAGDASAYGSAEVRLFLGRLAAFVPWDVGVLGFADAGRVYLDGRSPGDWKTSGGGGLWFAPVNRRFTISVTVARSADETKFYAGTGFGI